MIVYLSEHIRGLPIIHIRGAQQLGKVDNIKINLNDGIVYAYEWTEHIPTQADPDPDDDSVHARKATQETTVKATIPIHIHGSYAGGGSSMPMQGAVPPAALKKGITREEGDSQLFADEDEKGYGILAQNVHAMSDDALLIKDQHLDIYQTGGEVDNGMGIDSILNMTVAIHEPEEKELGNIQDLLVDSDTQRIMGIELSEGFWKNMLGGRSHYLPFPDTIEMSDEQLLVPSRYEHQLTENPFDLRPE